MATIGRRSAVAELPFGIRFGGTLGWLSWLGLHLVFLIGFRNRVVVLVNWAWNYVTLGPRQPRASSPTPSDARLERPVGVPTALEHLHDGERGVGEAGERVPAALAGRQRRRPIPRQVERVDDRDVVEAHVTRVLLLVIGEDHRATVPTRIEPARDGGVPVRRVADRADGADDLVDAGEHRRAPQPVDSRSHTGLRVKSAGTAR